MMFYELGWLFFAYSFIGWVLEILFVSIRRRKYVDRGVINGPLCIVYGVAGVVIAVTLSEIAGNLFFLFLYSALYATVIEWIAGHILEHSSQSRWWDYSHLPFNLDGYIALPVSVIWGLLGVAVVKWGNPLLVYLVRLIPQPLGSILLGVLTVVFLIDLADTLLTMAGIRQRLPQVEAVSNRLASLTLRMGHWILGRTERRMVKAHPQANFARREKVKSTVFAQGCSFYKIVLLFFIGAFLGDIVETIFCRITAGYWMSRSSVVWGPFSIVWGLAIALATLMLYRYKDRSSTFLFIVGTLLGGAYEYLCSVFTEIVFGTVFWDYSAIPFNLAGRINLLYCFFWGIAAVVWFRGVYPHVSRWIEKIPMRPGKIVTWVLVVFMAVDMVVSSAALSRYTARVAGIPPQNAVEVYLDEHYDNDRMFQIYPKAVHTDKPQSTVELAES